MKRDRQLIERFWALRRSVRFSSTETVLYLALVRLCRDAGWPPALLCPNAALCREAGIDESTLVRARHALIRKGVIGYAGTTAGSHRTCYVLSPLPVPDSGAADSPEAGMGMNANRDSAGLRIDRPDESAVGSRTRNPRAKGTEAGGPDKIGRAHV